MKQSGRLRIIGGEWRSRLIEVADRVGLRPTPDRVRQTVFDWLAPLIEGAQVLDAFAGSGALGLEALSRGAGSAVFLECDPTAANAIAAALERLAAADRAQIHATDALAWLAGTTARFDIVFIDPPFDSGLLPLALAQLGRILVPGGRAYLEWPAGAQLELPHGFEWSRVKQAGQVSYGLAAPVAALAGESTACP